jgi:hypothetical protein
VLHSEQGQQNKIDDDGLKEGALISSVDRLWHSEISYKGNGVKKDSKEEEITNDSIQEG